MVFFESADRRVLHERSFDGIGRLQRVSSRVGGADVVSRAYTYNSANQRIDVLHENGRHWAYGYDGLGQVISAEKRLPNGGTMQPGHSFGYTFDEIGNRVGTMTNGRSAAYSVDGLNRYLDRTVPGALDVRGEAFADALVRVDGVVAERTDKDFYRELLVDNSEGPVESEIAVTVVRGGVSAVEMRRGFLAHSPELFSYDADGNLLSDGRWNYVWDAENRLIAMDPLPSLAGGAVELKRLRFGYDSHSRRIWKEVFKQVNSVWELDSAAGYIYDGWQMIAETVSTAANPAPQLTRTYAWGPDVSGTLGGAGGVGGLLWATSLPGAASAGAAIPITNAACADGNGNVVAYINTGTLAVTGRADYSAFGEIVQQTGSARTLPFGFSTKFTDAETGLLYYGYRYYSPSTGRWLSRDPIEEAGGVNVYGFVGNDGVGRVDYLGLIDPLAQVLDKLFEIKQVCSCFKSIGSRVDSLMNRFLSGNRNFNKVITEVEGNFALLQDMVNRPAQYTGTAIAFREHILEGIFKMQKPHDSMSVQEFDRFLEGIYHDRISQQIGRASTALKTGESLSRKDAIDFTLTVFSIVPEKYAPMAFGPGYYLEAYRGTRRVLSETALPLFLRRGEDVIAACFGNDEEQANFAFRIIERDVFRDLIK